MIMTRLKLKIIGSIAAAALGIVLGRLNFALLLHAFESDNVLFAATHPAQMFWLQLGFSLLSGLIGLSVFWAGIVGKRLNLPVRLLILSVAAVISQWVFFLLKQMQIAAIAQNATPNSPAFVSLGNLNLEWVPLLTAAAVWICAAPFLFLGKKDRLPAR